MATDDRTAHIAISPDIDWGTLGELAEDGLTLKVACPPKCGRVVFLPGAELAERFGRSRTIGYLARRLKCAKCGSSWPSLSAVIETEITTRQRQELRAKWTLGKR